MAYVRKPKTHVVRFAEPHRLAGLTIKTRGVSIGTFARLARIFTEIGDIANSGESTPAAQVAAMETAVTNSELARELFADHLIEWDMQNQEDDDALPVDVPPTAEGLAILDDEEFITLVQDWMEAVGNVPAPLGEGSTTGAIIPVPSIPTVALSSSQAS